MENKIDRKINEIYNDIQTVKIQGATNVALATLEGMKYAAENTSNRGELLHMVESAGFKLSNARENEPLARNAVFFVLSQVKSNRLLESIQVLKAIQEFEEIIGKAKQKIKENSVEVLKNYQVILTHCHSSTATGAIVATSKVRKGLKVVSTETRPLYQGRKTAKGLLEAGVDVTQIVDSASASFIIDDRYLPVEAIVIGADEVFVDGRAINKVGSYQIALSAKEGKDELYVLTTLLKIDLTRQMKEPDIEMRPAREVWEEAPENLSIINPSFELIPSELVTGYITEAGVLSSGELESALRKYYPWID